MPHRTALFRFRLLLFCLAFLGPTAELSARSFAIDGLIVKGSERLPESYFDQELGLKAGSEIQEEDLPALQHKLLGTGLFRSANFFLSKGSKPGRFILQIDLEDDPSVFSDWAIGNSLFLTQEQRQGLGSELNPYSARVQVISRNLFRAQHRASLDADFDGMGILRAFEVAYGFPRFTQEGVQFDAHFEGVDPAARYSEVLGFGNKGEALWNFELYSDTAFQYGAAFYLNQGRRFTLPGFPRGIVGPKIGLRRETRLLSFRPSDGGAVGASVVFASEGGDQMVYEAEAAYTLGLWSSAEQTVQGNVLSVGGKSLSFRASWRLEQNLAATGFSALPKIYLLAETGGDRYREIHDRGYDFRIGTRFHSNGFIADIAFAYSTLPERLEKWRRER